MLKSEFFLQLLFFGMTAVIISLLVIRVYPPKLFHNPTAIASNIDSVAAVNSQIHPPTSISVPSLKLSLPIATGIIENNQWTLYDNKVSWPSTSKTPGVGNVILYAHNRDDLFGNLKNAEIGDQIDIVSNGKTYIYYIVEKHKVSPSDIDAILSETDQLTLYTCDGSFDHKRLVVIALPNTNPSSLN